MANQEHVEILKQGVEVWNKWRKEHREIEPDLSGGQFKGITLSMVDLSRIDLSYADFSNAILYRVNFGNADLFEANFSRAHLVEPNFSGANLAKAIFNGAVLLHANFFVADLSESNLSGVDLSGATLTRATLNGAIIRNANLSGANLSEASLFTADLIESNLSEANLVKTNLTKAILTNCSIYGISAWDVDLAETEQLNLVITPPDEPTITVDNLKIAQFLYLLLNNAEIRDVIDTIVKKAVLILGRFTSERKAVLDALKEALRTHDYLPILFDFDKPSSQDLTETVSTLAHLARFIIVDLSDPSSAPYEVGSIASNHIKPIQAIFHPSDEAKRVFAMFPDLIMRYHWVLPPYEYQDQEQLLASLQERVIAPAERKAEELARLRAQEFDKL